MRDLIRIGLSLAAMFAVTFVLLRASGVLTLDDVRLWFAGAHAIAPGHVAALVVALLFADLFIAMPTLTIAILGGYFLGAAWGTAAACIGMMSAGLTGYGLSRRYGWALLSRLYRDGRKLARIRAAFGRHGVLVLLVCRALPILPEVSCCLAGATRMPFARFLAGFSAGTIPFATIASYAGSLSSVEDPGPAILAFIALPASLWLGWYLVRRRRHAERRRRRLRARGAPGPR